MNGLREMFDDLVADPAPMPKASADDLYAAGRRRRHMRRGIASAAAAIVAALLAGVILRLPLSTTGSGDAAGVLWAVAGDPAHLYVLRSACETSPCRQELLVSSDQGVTWQKQATVTPTVPLEVLGPRILVRHVMATAPPVTTGPNPSTIISVDAGETWGPVNIGTEPMPAAPAGASLVCGNGGSLYVSTKGIPCTLYAADPATRLVRPLAHQPALAGTVISTSPSDAGLWVSGYDPASGRPGVAVSHDAGRTWITRVFDELPRVPIEPEGWVGRRYLPDVASADGRIAYAAFTAGDWVDPAFTPGPDATSAPDPRGGELVVRTVDGGLTWHRADLGRSIPASVTGIADGLSYVTRDGGHALVYFDNRRGGFAILLSADGGRYQRTNLPGLPDHAAPRRNLGGVYVAYDFDGVYLSDDGITWTPVRLPPLKDGAG